MLPVIWGRVKEGVRDNERFAIILSLALFVALVGVFRLMGASPATGEGKAAWVEKGAFEVHFLEPQNAAFASLSSGTVFYPIGCKKLPKRDEGSYLYFRTRGEAESVGLTMAKGC